MTQPYEPTPPTDAAKALGVLKSLPSLEDTTAQVQTAISEITSATSKLIPGITWETADNADTGSCQRPYEQTDGKDYYLPNRIAEKISVSEQQWAQIQQAAKEAAAKLDATEVQVMKNQPGNHDVGFYGPTGLFIKISYGGNLVVSGYTGCRLPRDKK
ncbi:LppA family lipoprotein [Mycobacterium sp. SM1]|nr:LppA family lipoprotein [Mycobacterium sp. SM1]